MVTDIRVQDAGPKQKKYIAEPTVSRFLLSDAYIRGLMGPFGSGKSVGCVVDRNIKACGQRPDAEKIRYTRYAVVRNTYKELEDSTVKTCMQWFGSAGVYKSQAKELHLRYRQPDGTIVNCELLFRALNRPDDVSKLLSTEYTGAWINEFREIPLEILFNLIGRINRYPDKNMVPDEIWSKDGMKLVMEGAWEPQELREFEEKGYKVIRGGATIADMVLDTNPFDEDDEWDKFFKQDETSADYRKLKKDYEDIGEEPPKIELFEQPGGLDPKAENLRNLGGGRKYYLDMIRAAEASGKNRDWINVHVHGKRGTSFSGKPVYADAFDITRHMSAVPLEPVRGLPIAVGRDYGLDPAAVFFQIDPITEQWLILGEYVRFNIAEEEFLDGFATYAGFRFPGYEFVFYADPAGNERSQGDGNTCFAIDRARGYRVYPGGKYLSDRLPAVRHLLNSNVRSLPMLLLDPSCIMLGKAFRGGYKYRKLQVPGEERHSETPEKNKWSHVMNAFEHAASFFVTPYLTGGSKPGWPQNQGSRIYSPVKAKHRTLAESGLR